MDILMFATGMFFCVFLLFGVTEDDQTFKMIAVVSLIICILLIIYINIVNKVITDTYINTDTIIINQKEIKFDKPMKIKISRYHIPYCGGMFDKIGYYIGE